ncbi:PIR Superfamily Protein [Plasmodium ovale wallikeri]|uniref:PIR Superfamily Protein n=1 Tax=Plasmodium ovale wallikeri TaxID=864142 RepID=A0A1A9AFI5_PLAOA|nr:PIR Superfamily Protein [Plasmodium ovale wallikeri]
MVEYDYSVVTKFPISKALFDNIKNDKKNYYNSYCHDAIRDYPYDPTNFMKDCLFFVKGIMYLDSNMGSQTFIQETDISMQDHCKYLTYRLNYELENISKYPKHLLELYNNLKSKIIEMISKLNICSQELKELDKIVLKNIQVLDDFNENIIKLTYNFPNTTKESCAYAKKCVEIYEKNMRYCYSNMNSSFCTELTKFGKIYNKYEEGEYNKCPDLKNHFLYTGSDNARTETTSIESCKTSLSRQIVVEGANSPIVHDAETSLGPRIYAGFSMSLSILLILFIMYKFTYFGTWINSKILNIKRMLFNEDEESNPVSPSASQNKHTISKKKGYLITYNSIQ